MRGYFGIGVWRFSKVMNAGNLFRTAHAFGASFVFTIEAEYKVRKARSDTSLTPRSLPWYDCERVEDFHLPEGCRLVGVELTEEAVELPRFHHPIAAAYIMGAERESLPPAIVERCDQLVRIPTRFSLNVATAGAIVMYDRCLVHGGFGDRATTSASPPPAKPPHVHGGRFRRKNGAGPTTDE